MNARVVCAWACTAVSVAVTPALATDDEHKSSYRERFTTCAHESKGLKGDEHQRFMSECLKEHGAAAKKEEAVKTSTEPGHQQNKMKSCNEEAGRKNLHGDERRSFMSSCLKG